MSTRGDGKARGEGILVVENLDVKRERVGLAPDVAGHDGHRAELTHRAGVAEDESVQQAPLDVGQRHSPERLPPIRPEYDRRLFFLRSLLLHERNQLAGDERRGHERRREHHTGHRKDDLDIVLLEPGPEPPVRPEEQHEDHP